MALFAGRPSCRIHLAKNNRKYGTLINPEESLQTFLSTGTTSVNLKMAYQLMTKNGHRDTHIRGELGQSLSRECFM